VGGILCAAADAGMVKHDGGTCLVKGARHLGTDALGCAGDEGDSALKVYAEAHV
jgi:hypothetical protein